MSLCFVWWCEFVFCMDSMKILRRAFMLSKNHSDSVEKISKKPFCWKLRHRSLSSFFSSFVKWCQEALYLCSFCFFACCADIHEQWLIVICGEFWRCQFLRFFRSIADQLVRLFWGPLILVFVFVSSEVTTLKGLSSEIYIYCIFVSIFAWFWEHWWLARWVCK